MEPGPDIIIACPYCDGLGRIESLCSGNTFGAQVWSDGKMIAPMLPQNPEVIKCRHCGDCYWLKDAAELGAIGYGNKDIDPTWTNAEFVDEADEDGYCKLLGRCEDDMQEKTLRILAWWRGNDVFRVSPGASVSDKAMVAGAREDNLKALSLILEKEILESQIMHAEVLRELGVFLSAKSILKSIKINKYEPTVRQLLRLCENNDKHVRELDFRDDHSTPVDD